MKVKNQFHSRCWGLSLKSLILTLSQQLMLEVNDGLYHLHLAVKDSRSLWVQEDKSSFTVCERCIIYIVVCAAACVRVSFHTTHTNSEDKVLWNIKNNISISSVFSFMLCCVNLMKMMNQLHRCKNHQFIWRVYYINISMTLVLWCFNVFINCGL